jgi:hypothetical protein
MNQQPIIIDDPDILQFYNENPSLDIVHINKLIVQLLQLPLLNKSNENSDNIQISQLSNIIQNTTTENLNTISQFIPLLSNNILESLLTTLHHDNTKSSLIQPIVDALSGTQNQTINDIKFELCKTNEVCSSIASGALQSSERNKEYLHNMERNITDRLAQREPMYNNLNEYLNKKNNSSNKGQYAENNLEWVLHRCFPSGEIINTSKFTAACDFRVIRENKPTILFENKEYSRNVKRDEVEKFIRDIREQKCSGIFLSNSSGITCKENFHIERIDANIAIYIHYADYSREYITAAVNIIDNLTPLYEAFNSKNDEKQTKHIPMTEEQLDLITKEYNVFHKNKMDIIKNMKSQMDLMVNQVENLDAFLSLRNFLHIQGQLNNNVDSINVDNVQKTEFICEYCHQKCKNERGLRIHRTKCAKKHTKPPVEQQNNEPIDQYFVVDTSNNQSDLLTSL